MNRDHLTGRTIGVLILTSAALSCASGQVGDASPDGSVVEDSTQSVASPDLVRHFIETQMQPGSAAFVIPSPIDRDESVDAVLEVSALKIAPEDIERRLEKELGRPTTGVSAEIRLANRMLARALTTLEPDAAVINIIGESDRALPFDEPVQWRWSVTPILAGEIRFRAVLLAPVAVDGSQTSYEVRSFDEVVTVTVSPAKRVGDVIGWTVDNWAAVAGVVAALWGLGSWIMSRRRRS